MRNGSRTSIALACLVALVFAFLFTSCAKTPQMADNFLVENELVLQKGTETAVLVALKANPTYRKVVVKVADALAMVTFPADGLHGVKEMVMKTVDLSKFSATERFFAELLIDEAVNQMEQMRDKHCVAKPGSALCLDKSAWVKTSQVYLNKFSGWLRAGVALADSGSTVNTRSAFPVLEPLK